MKYRVSVVVPVYNCKKYLSRAVDSVISQSNFNDYELILVDDGSTDGSADICDSYANRFANIKVIHQKNAGVSVARNAGINASVGEWLFFLDSDDYLLDDAISKLLTYSEADLVCGKHTSNIEVSENFDGLFEDGIYYKEDIIEKLNNVLVTGQMFYPCWSRLYKKCIVDKYNIKFPVGIKIAEDMVFVYSYLSYCESIAFLNDDIYFYYVNTENTTSVIPKSFDVFLYIFNWQKDYFVKNETLFNKIESAFVYRSFMSLKTSSSAMSLKTGVNYISTVVNNEDFYRLYLRENYCKFSCKTDELLDKFIRKKNSFFIYLVIRFCTVKSKLLNSLTGDNNG